MATPPTANVFAMDTDDADPPGTGPTGRPAGDTWPPSFPHSAIDALLARLERADELDSTAAAELLLLVAREAQRLRATVVRLSAVRLADAREEARAIVAEAHHRADELRALALDVLDTRLDESERVHAALRELIRVEQRHVALHRDDDPFGYADSTDEPAEPEESEDPEAGR